MSADQDLGWLRDMLDAARLDADLESLPYEEREPVERARDAFYALAPPLAQCALALVDDGHGQPNWHHKGCRGCQALTALAKAREAQRG